MSMHPLFFLSRDQSMLLPLYKIRQALATLATEFQKQQNRTICLPVLHSVRAGKEQENTATKRCSNSSGGGGSAAEGVSMAALRAASC